MTHSAEEPLGKSLLQIRSVDGVLPPDIPRDLAEYARLSFPTQQKTVKRPDTAPAYVVVMN